MERHTNHAGGSGFCDCQLLRLDKQQKSFQGVTTPTAVKQDLVISAYKPNGGLEERFAKKGETEDGVWDFVRTHLGNLPVVKPRGGQLEPIVERDPRILFDRTVAFYVRHGIPVPISSPEFQAGLAEKFPERDGMYFLSDQAAEYDKVRMKMEGIGQLTLFVEDERSAVAWLRNYLKNKPCKYQDIQPEFFRTTEPGLEEVGNTPGTARPAGPVLPLLSRRRRRAAADSQLPFHELQGTAQSARRSCHASRESARPLVRSRSA